MAARWIFVIAFALVFYGNGAAFVESFVNYLLDCTMLPPNFGVTNSGWFQTGK